MTALLAFICFFSAGSLLVLLLLPNKLTAAEQRLQEIAPNFQTAQGSEPLQEVEQKTRVQRLSAMLLNAQISKSALIKVSRLHQQLEATTLENGKRNYYLLLGSSFLVSLFIFQNFALLLQSIIAIAITISVAVLRYRQLMQQQRLAFEEQLPKVVDQLARSVTTGLSVPQALASCAEYASFPVQGELSRLSKQLSLGIALDQALAESQQRIPVTEFKFLAVILILNQQTGGRLSDALQNLANSLRNRKALRMKLATLTSEPRAAAKIVSLFPPLTLLGIYWGNPMQWEFLIHDESGQSILVYAFTSIILGLFIIHRLSRGES